MTSTRDKIADLFGEYWNDFITVSAFASYYGIAEEKACRIVNTGRILWNRRADRLKQDNPTA